MLDFYEPPDPYVPAAEWAVVNVSGQRFHINMKHIKEYHKGKKYGIRLVGKIEKLERFKLGRLYIEVGKIFLKMALTVKNAVYFQFNDQVLSVRTLYFK